MKIFTTSILLLVSIAFAIQGVAQTPPVKPKNQKEKVSYIIGMNTGNMLKHQKIDYDLEYLIIGLKDILADKKPQLSQKEVEAVMGILRKEMMAKVSDENQKAGEKYLADNAKKKGVTTTKSGLQYEVVRAGTGAIPKAMDHVVVHYKGTLITGKEFDSSYRSGKPAEFPVKGVIPGWVEALQLMKKGARWKLTIPANLAYGAKGAGRMIGPNSTLLFDIELLDIKSTK